MLLLLYYPLQSWSKFWMSLFLWLNLLHQYQIGFEINILQPGRYTNICMILAIRYLSMRTCYMYKFKYVTEIFQPFELVYHHKKSYINYLTKKIKAYIKLFGLSIKLLEKINFNYLLLLLLIHYLKKLYLLYIVIFAFRPRGFANR